MLCLPVDNDNGCGSVAQPTGWRKIKKFYTHLWQFRMCDRQVESCRRKSKNKEQGELKELAGIGKTFQEYIKCVCMCVCACSKPVS